MSKKRGQVWGSFTGWVIAVTILVIIVVFSILLKDKLLTMAQYLKNLFR